MQTEQRVVWILGAGFSMPLGGPPFRDLISEKTTRPIGLWSDYTNIALPGGHQAGILAMIVWHLYTRGTDLEKNAFTLWEDAEQFIDCLDIAAGDPKGFMGQGVLFLLKQMLDDRRPNAAPLKPGVLHLFAHLDVLHREAVRFIAGACSTFLLRAEDAAVADESEQWGPYRRWYDRLVPGADSVITFNYDRVLDVLTEYGRRRLPVKDVFMSPAGHTSDYFDGHAEYVVPV